MKETLYSIDRAVLAVANRSGVWVARLSLFIIYFWFGLLKVIDLSPASPLIQELFEKTMPIMPFATFLVLFGLFECLIGLLWLIKGLERLAIPLFAFHMVTTFMPIFLVAGIWTAPLVPTLEGQYIVKNLALIAAVLMIVNSLTPLKNKTTVGQS
jgi:uncharacterized membrane protein YkgB